MKMSDLHIELTADTSAVERKARIISKRLAAMADELELAKGLEEGAPTRCAQCGWILRPGAGHRFRDGLYCTYCYGAMKVDLERALAQTPKAEKEPIKCAYCGGLVDVGSTWYRSGHVYCSKGCAEMAGMEPAVQTIRIDRPEGMDQALIDKVVDTVILRLRDYHGLEV
jgi:hypothetical protein